jgi:multiple sugar transport system ATP-binding protein
MADVVLKDVRKTYPGGVAAVCGIDIEIQDGEFLVLVGPSGCGKSTTLRMVAGLESPTAGEIFIGGRCVNNVAPKDRDIAMVFQNYALYPHMTVYKNMAFGLELRHTPKNEILGRVTEAAKTLGIEHLLSRTPRALSGGERQRVALGRAMVRKPSVFLLDEPLSNLDAKLRASMRKELTKLHDRLGATFVFVTHDQTEAMTMGDRIVVMDGGLVRQVSAPGTLYERPENVFVAQFIGSPQMNIVRGELAAANGRAALRAFGEKWDVDAALPGLSLAQSERPVLVGIRPEAILLRAGGDAGCVCESTALDFAVTVDAVELLGNEQLAYLRRGGTELVARAGGRARILSGQRFQASVNLAELHFFDPDTGDRL